MTTIRIDLPDHQVAVLSAQASAQGLTLEDWIQQRAIAGASAIDWSQCSAVESVPGKVSGAWVLKDTRMPVSAIFENLEGGASIDDIMEWFHGLDRMQVQEVIEFAARSLDKPPTYAPECAFFSIRERRFPFAAIWRRYLGDHIIGISADLGWARLRNGDLLAAAEQAGYELLLTTDKNLRYQQNLKERMIAMW